MSGGKKPKAASKQTSTAAKKQGPIASFVGNLKALLTCQRQFTPTDAWTIVQLFALVALGFMVVPQIWWMATVGFPNWLNTAQNRFLDRGQPLLVQVYKDWCPTILNVPIFERLEWYLVRLPHFMTGMFYHFFVGFFTLLYQGHTIVPTPNKVWTDNWTNMWLSEFLEPREPGTISWLPGATDDPTYFYFEANFELMGGDVVNEDGKVFPGWAYDENCYGAGSKVAFRRSKQGGELETLAIRLHHDVSLPTPLVVRPGDKAWEGAKLFVMHGANHRLVLAFHPMRHFPMDAVNGVTKNMEYMPHYHVLYKLLIPHFKLTLPLEDAVMNSWFLSILLNPYFLHPFDTNQGEAILNYAVWEFSHYNFSDWVLRPQPEDQPSARSVFLQGYYAPMREFVSQVVHSPDNIQSFRDSHVRDWGNEIAKHVPGFPTGDELVADTELLVDSLVNIMFDLSFQHALQHYMYGTGEGESGEGISMRMRPWRIHHRPPQSADEDWDFSKGSINFWEAMIEYVTNYTFFVNKPYSSIEKINYGFSGSLQLAQARMIEAWQSYNRQRQEFPEVFPGNLMPLKRIGPAIDY